ncbi:MAG: NADH-quinone oxidoreductase subunit C [Verrucomicrobia bacterium]|nr:MAG: NADH-quinone oxidoreductase subunit C [Verrucomicrobiota bacterium]TAE89325.1 MAG: NADH-quinone oxidoreductase subunit C [Verrucomicrobiota bacterium]TAF27799.1 MAG: NADH-quinone oxidoreductase subunit C [Verrucomicrobiota bacterium]TAF42648.1 MAG: NADH-quinone oxidoreductase subunit C [Verrucomicrobiota bacterium]
MSAAQDLESLSARFGSEVVGTKEFRGESTILVKLGVLHDVLAAAKKELGYAMVIDISSLDHFGEHPRFEMVYELATLDDSKHLRVKAKVAEDEEVPTATDIWLGADWHEREVYDMMGIRFSGHPNLKRILMWEGYPFHPLRKDFPLAGRPSEMPDVAFTGVAPLEGGPFVTCAGMNDSVKREPRARVVD